MISKKWEVICIAVPLSKNIGAWVRRYVPRPHLADRPTPRAASVIDLSTASKEYTRPIRHRLTAKVVSIANIVTRYF